MSIVTLAILDTAQIGRLLGLSPATVRRYVRESVKSGGRYEHRPFPQPDGKIGSYLYWNKSRLPEIEEWHVKKYDRDKD